MYAISLKRDEHLTPPSHHRRRPTVKGAFLPSTRANCFICHEDLTEFSVKCDKCDLVACKHHAGFVNEAHFKRYQRSTNKSWLCSKHGLLFHCSRCGDPLDSCEQSRKIVITNPIGCEYVDAKGEYCSTWICLEKCASKPADFDGIWYCDLHRDAKR